MEVIPVIDVRGGLAVRAVAGERALYKPLETPLAASADPIAVAAGYRALYPFRTLYVADLDGIAGRGADHALQRRLANDWLGDEVWIDDGLAGLRAFGDVGIPPLLSFPTRGEERSGEAGAHPVPSPLWGGSGRGESRQAPIESQLPEPIGMTHVLGSEAVGTLGDYEGLRKRAGASAVLSLDFRGETFLGPPGLSEDGELWPSRVIVMTLACVVTGEGPDLARLQEIVARAGTHRRIYAAGGVRDRGDLVALAQAGVAGALIASALHSGQIKTGDLEEVAGI